MSGRCGHPTGTDATDPAAGQRPIHEDIASLFTGAWNTLRHAELAIQALINHPEFSHFQPKNTRQRASLSNLVQAIRSWKESMETAGSICVCGNGVTVPENVAGARPRFFPHSYVKTLRTRRIPPTQIRLHLLNCVDCANDNAKLQAWCREWSASGSVCKDNNWDADTPHVAVEGVSGSTAVEVAVARESGTDQPGSS